MKLSQEHKDYLDRKHNGGVSNQKGNTFETIYATKEIVRLFAEGADINTTYLATQLEYVFVDDLNILYTDGKRVYCQLKDKINLSWGVAPATIQQLLPLLY
ncbi:MAG: hypothetical protein K2K94_10845 [Muribaculaceae bacterium]|nr:hypothetical protein [Muribaculaceae bacterium]